MRGSFSKEGICHNSVVGQGKVQGTLLFLVPIPVPETAMHPIKTYIK
jgi:hypothetical protein